MFVYFIYIVYPRGVAIILHKRIASGFKGVYPASKRAGAVDVDIGGAKVRFVAAYLPDSSYDDADVEATYCQLDGFCSKAPQAKRNIVIGGDLNVKIGKRGLGEDSMVGPYSAGSRNARGDLLTNWIDHVLRASITDSIGLGTDHRSTETDMLLETPSSRNK